MIPDMNTLDQLLSGEPKQRGPKPCPDCQCPIQWRPFESTPWTCYDCEAPPSDAVTRFVRILTDTEDGVKWSTMRPREVEAVVVEDFDFDLLPEPPMMTADTIASYRRWMTWVGRDRRRKPGNRENMK